MYVKTQCSHCKNESFSNVRIHIQETRTGPKIKDIEVTETISESILIKEISKTLEENRKEGITTEEFINILTECFGIPKTLTVDLIEKLKVKNECN